MAPKVSSTASSSASNGKSHSSPSQTPDAISALFSAYTNQTSPRLKFIDAFLVFLILGGVVQFAYCVLVTNFPFNAFLAGWVLTDFCLVLWRDIYGSCSVPQRVFAFCALCLSSGSHIDLTFIRSFSSNVGQFVLTASLRAQVNPENKSEFKEVSPERYVSFQLFSCFTFSSCVCVTLISCGLYTGPLYTLPVILYLGVSSSSSHFPSLILLTSYWRISTPSR